jgi:hypothetical protein
VASSWWNSKSKVGVKESWATHQTGDSGWNVEPMGLYPNMPHQPIPGMVALFVRVAHSFSCNPRAPHTQPRTSTDFSYTVAVKSSMDSGHFNGRNRGPGSHFGGSSLAQGNGQGTSHRGPNPHYGGTSVAHNIG